VTDGNFGNLGTILEYKDQYSMGDAEALLQKHGKLRVITQCFIPEGLRRTKAFLRILPNPKDKNDFKAKYEAIGVGNYKSLKPDSISEQVLGMAIREGLKIGADAMLFQEGAALIQVAKGYSIGLFNSFSLTNSAATGYGNVSVAGLGWGKGESGYVSKPWLRVQFFQERPVPLRVIPRVVPKPPAVKPEVKKPANDIEEALKKAKRPTIEEGVLGVKEVTPPTPPARR
jgi:hypothetical protein